MAPTTSLAHAHVVLARLAVHSHIGDDLPGVRRTSSGCLHYLLGKPDRDSLEHGKARREYIMIRAREPKKEETL